jgi:hypothetical protein
MPAAIVLLLVVILYRIFFGIVDSASFGGLHNFSPIAAVALCGAVYLPKRLAVALPLAGLFVSDAVLNLVHYHLPLLTFDIVPRYLALGIICLIGFAFRGRARLLPLLGASFAGSLIFFVITDTGSWIAAPQYAKTFAGWTQALTTGIPGYPPTWWFYRQSLAGDLFFTAIFALVMAGRTKAADAPAPAVPTRVVGEGAHRV